MFVEFSLGYRPKRKAHEALRLGRRHLMGGRVMRVYDMDIRACFERVNHDWLCQIRLEQPTKTQAGVLSAFGHRITPGWLLQRLSS